LAPLVFDLLTLHPPDFLQLFRVFVEQSEGLFLDFLLIFDPLVTQYFAPVVLDRLTPHFDDLLHDFRVIVEHLSDLLFLPLDVTQYLAPVFLDLFTLQPDVDLHAFRVLVEQCLGLLFLPVFLLFFLEVLQYLFPDFDVYTPHVLDFLHFFRDIVEHAFFDPDFRFFDEDLTQYLAPVLLDLFTLQPDADLQAFKVFTEHLGDLLFLFFEFLQYFFPLFDILTVQVVADLQAFKVLV
jgi:hypothetical protein